MAAVLIGSPAVAQADAGIPMLPVQYPALLLYLAPVIAIEFLYLLSQLHTNGRRTFVVVTIVNTITMGLGFPLAWGIYMGLDRWLQFPPVSAQVFTRLGWMPVWVCARLFPAWEGLGQQVWPVLVVFVILMIPGYFLSGILKSCLVEWYDLLSYRGNSRAAVWEANRLSHLFLAIAGCAVLYRTYRP